MKETNSIEKAYNLAKEAYSAIGVDSDKAVERLSKMLISLHCRQGDDVTGLKKSRIMKRMLRANDKMLCINSGAT